MNIVVPHYVSISGIWQPGTNYWLCKYSRVPNSSPDPNNRPGRTNFLKINKRPGVLLSKNDPNKSVLDRKLSKINKNVLPHYSELKSIWVLEKK